MTFTLTIEPRGKTFKPFPLTVNLTPEDPTVQDLKASIASRSSLNVHRQRLTTSDKKVLDVDSKKLSEFGVNSGDKLLVKDLGPQMSWRTVYLIEYAGPLFIYPICYYLQQLLYGKTFQHSDMQMAAFFMVIGHYVKRELESMFVHRFSSDTMPLFNVFKNSAYYYFIAGVLIAFPVLSPAYSEKALRNDIRGSSQYVQACVAVFVFAELSNMIIHLKLRALRPAGTRDRKIAYGYGFHLVSCPNYSFESLAWLAFALMTLHWSSFLWWALSTAQMLSWALKRHRRYKKEFGKEYPRNRTSMIPFVI